MTDFDYEPVPDDQREMLRDVVLPTLNIPIHLFDSFVTRLGANNLRAIHCGGELIGGLGIHQTAQWFGGRSVRCGGVSLVGIAAEHRGRGAAAELMSSALREMSEQGVPLSTLYASTQRLYRKVGYEQAGMRCQYELPVQSIGIVGRELPVRQIPVSDGVIHDLDQFKLVAERRAQITNGNLDRTNGLWQMTCSHRHLPVYAYLIGETSNPQGYAIFVQEALRPGRSRIVVRDMAAVTPAAVRRLWSFFCDHSSMVESVRWHGPAIEPLLSITPELELTSVHPMRWMMRLVDVRAALNERGYPPGADAELHLEIRDDVLSANNGRFVLRVVDGAVEVSAGGRGDLRTDVRGLVPLYSGLFTPWATRSLGIIDANDRTLTAAARIFAGPEPWMPDMF